MRFRDIRALEDHKDVPDHLLAATTFVEEKEQLSPVVNRRSRRMAGNRASIGRARAFRDKITWHPHRIAFLQHQSQRAAEKKAAKKARYEAKQVAV